MAYQLTLVVNISLEISEVGWTGSLLYAVTVCFIKLDFQLGHNEVKKTVDELNYSGVYRKFRSLEIGSEGCKVSLICSSDLAVISDNDVRNLEKLNR